MTPDGEGVDAPSDVLTFRLVLGGGAGAAWCFFDLKRNAIIVSVKSKDRGVQPQIGVPSPSSRYIRVEKLSIGRVAQQWKNNRKTLFF